MKNLNQQSLSASMSGDFAWVPPPERIAGARLTDFIRRHHLPDFSSLLSRSTTDIAWFTSALLDYLDIRFYEPYTDVLDLAGGLAYPKWCAGGVMNIVHNCLDKYIGSEVEQRVAVIWEGEEGQTIRLTYRQLWEQVNQAANALRSLGLGKGDVVGLFVPMTPEAVVALLAVAKIGAIILPLFSGYGAGALVTRLVDAGAKALVTADGFFRRGQVINMKAVADEAAESVPTLEHILVYRRAGLDVAMQPGRDHAWDDLVLTQPKEAATERTPAEATLMIIYTSGTTGQPKGAVHTHCGFPVKAAQDMAFGTDIHPGEVIYWVTDIGWMMGPWLIFGALINAATFLIYDGSPDHPGPDRLWSLVERHRVNALGLSPTLVRALMAYGDSPHQKHDLSSLKLFSYTGEPCNPEPWRWLYEDGGHKRAPIINYTGGTECSGGILMGNPILPMKPCSFPAPCPGMAADVYDEDGYPVVNQVGELVVKAPWIGMTRGFWNNPARYEETYWSRFPGVWVHGDWAARDGDGQWYVLGRSDDTIKVAGKRLGPAEVESVLAGHPAVLDSAAIGVPDELKGNALVIFCVPRAGVMPTDELNRELRGAVTRALGKPLAPKALYFISDLPKTRNAKLMRRMLRAAFLGQDPGDSSALVNPEILEEIRRLV